MEFHLSEALQSTLSALVSIDWLAVVRSLAPVVTAYIAYVALRSWQRQDKARSEFEFLDALIEATHTYIVEMNRPLAFFRIAKIGMTSHVENWVECDEQQKAVKGAIAYIQKRGDQDGKRLSEALNALEPSVVRLRSLLAKGQVFRFPEYSKAQNAITLLIWQHDRLRSFTSIIESPTWNWDHPEVRSLLEKVIAIDADEVGTEMGTSNVAIIAFAQAIYEKLYGPRKLAAPLNWKRWKP